MGVSKSFGTNITENHFGNLSALFFGQALDQMGQKCRYFAQKISFGLRARAGKRCSIDMRLFVRETDH